MTMKRHTMDQKSVLTVDMIDVTMMRSSRKILTTRTIRQIRVILMIRMTLRNVRLERASTVEISFKISSMPAVTTTTMSNQFHFQSGPHKKVVHFALNMRINSSRRIMKKKHVSIILNGNGSTCPGLRTVKSACRHTKTALRRSSTPTALSKWRWFTINDTPCRVSILLVFLRQAARSRTDSVVSEQTQANRRSPTDGVPCDIENNSSLVFVSIVCTYGSRRTGAEPFSGKAGVSPASARRSDARGVPSAWRLPRVLAASVRLLASGIPK
mmetsp:Transcript_132978/g.258889  ORF Transcript_132978/g.258889 Transcript_132978/m.258889 type:complete len:270 (+) Transcript_132978:119-928(+)